MVFKEASFGGFCWALLSYRFFRLNSVIKNAKLDGFCT